ncbi:diguanylate cyclase [Nitrincola sp.]|uniref:sensor domain-containing diguanylate cyclase n=1 Tax=Nitrincola sp. TaxID=1926584 RepID=UPI003A8DEC99
MPKIVERVGALNSPQRALAVLGVSILAAGVLFVGSDLLGGYWTMRRPDLATAISVFKGIGFVFVMVMVLRVLRRCQREFEASERREAQQRQQLRTLDQFRENVIDNALVWINVLDPEWRITVWNKAAEQISGYGRDEVLGNPDIWELLYPDPTYRASISAKVAEIIEQGTEVEWFESCIRAKDGQDKIIAWNSRRFFDEDGTMIGAIAIGQDISARKQAEHALIERERQLATLMSNLPGMAYRCLNDPHWTMLFISDGCLALTGYSPASLVGNAKTYFSDLTHPDDRQRLWDEVQKALSEGRSFALEYRIIRQDGSERWVWEQGRNVVVDSDSYIEGLIFDITNRKYMEQELERLATHDSLTGLYNRHELMRRLNEDVARAERYQLPLCVLLIDIDNFKRVNDQFGHQVGDEVLCRFGMLLRETIRHVDYAGRYGGEELVVVLPETCMQEGFEIAERLRGQVEAERWAHAAGQLGTITISVGVVGYPDLKGTVEELFLAADRALYRAKNNGRNQVCIA